MEVEIEKENIMRREDIESVRINVVKKQTKSLRAMASVKFSNGLTVDGFRIFDGRNGLFAGLPSIRDETAENGWRQTSFIKKDDYKVLSDVIVEAYKSEVGGSKSSSNKNSNGDSWESWTKNSNEKNQF